MAQGTIRILLEELKRDALVRLMQIRDLPPTAVNDERRESLARSYRGRVDMFAEDLRFEDLVTIFRSRFFEIDGKLYHLSNPAAYARDALVELACKAFHRAEIDRAFDPWAGDVDDGDDHEDVATDDSAQTENPGDGFREVDETWSRPKMIVRILDRLGLERVERLRTPRFHALLASLRELDIEACLADDDDETPLTDDDETPGVAAKLRLRRLSAAHTRVPRVEDPSRGGPEITLSADEPPVSRRAVRPPDYTIALQRLQFLTSVPSVERRSMPGWPAEYLAAATHQSKLSSQERDLLQRFAIGLVMGTHSPYDVVPQLTQFLSADEWRELLRDFQRLNPFQPDFVQAVVEQLLPVSPPPSSVVAVRPSPEDLRPRPDEAPPTQRGTREPLAAAKQKTDSREDVGPKNQRELGALDGMFDDE